MDPSVPSIGRAPWTTSPAVLEEETCGAEGCLPSERCERCLNTLNQLATKQEAAAAAADSGAGAVGTTLMIPFGVPVGCRPLATDIPSVGYRLHFRYPEARRFAHRFYTGPPGDPESIRVSTHTSRVDLHQAIDVEEVVGCQVGEHVIISVRFVNAADGTMLWTNAKRDQHWWVWWT